MKTFRILTSKNSKNTGGEFFAVDKDRCLYVLSGGRGVIFSSNTIADCSITKYLKRQTKIGKHTSEFELTIRRIK